MHLLDSQIGGLIVLFSQDRARVRGPQILSLGEILVSGDLQYRGAASVVDYIPDDVIGVRMLAMLAVRLGT